MTAAENALSDLAEQIGDQFGNGSVVVIVVPNTESAGIGVCLHDGDIPIMLKALRSITELVEIHNAAGQN